MDKNDFEAGASGYTTTGLWTSTKKQAKVAAAMLGKSLVQLMDEAVAYYCQHHGVPILPPGGGDPDGQ